MARIRFADRSPSGFTLIELLIVISIIGVLAGIAYPAYKDYVYESYRSEAKNLLLEVAARQEEYYLNNKSYTSDLTDLGYGDANSIDTDHNRYEVSVSSASGTAFSLLATAQGDQANDDCGNFTLNNLGVKGVSGSGNDCW